MQWGGSCEICDWYNRVIPYNVGKGETIWEPCFECGGTGYDRKQYAIYEREQRQDWIKELKWRKSEYAQNKGRRGKVPS